MKKILFLLILASGAAFGQQRDLKSKSAEVLKNFTESKFAAVMGMVDEHVFTNMDSTHLRMTWEQLSKSAGKYIKTDSVYEGTQPPFAVVMQRLIFEKRKINMRTIWGDNDKIKGLYFLPVDERVPYKSPSYVDTSKYVEKKTLVNNESFHLPGTLTVPKSPGKHPAVILIQGAGATDRDETMGSTKIFRDLANGLATNGIVVLRYEKRYRVFKSKLEHQKVWTLRDETMDDVPSALKILKADPAVDTNKIFLIGHGLGGYLLPRIAKENPSVKGLILLAAHARNLEDVYAAQSLYLATETMKDENARKHFTDSVTAVQEKIRKFTNDNYNDSTLYFQSPAAYWIDLHNHDALTAAKASSLPMLLQFGVRDFQTTMEDISLWQKVLKDKKDADFKMYPKLNHFFMAGEGKSLPAEYEKPGNVDFSVISDIAAWISGK